MGNVIKIKRGEGKPGNGILAEGELGFDKQSNNLYIGTQDGTAIPIGGGGGSSGGGECNWSGGAVDKHVYLTGAAENSSTANTSQIVFGTSTNNHVAISSNTNAIVINPNTSQTTNQIVLYLDKPSQFPSGISAKVTGTLTGTASRATADGNGKNIADTYETKSNATTKYNAISEWQSGAADIINEHTNSIKEHAVSIKDLRTDVSELSSTAGIPNYVKTEAESVIDKVLAAQGRRTFTLAAITDLHYGHGTGGYTDGVHHACQAMKYIDERIKLDAVAVLGDYTDGYPASGLDNALSDFKAVNSVLDKLRFATNLRQQGNHDYYADNFAKTHRFIQAYSEGVVWGDKLGGYYYRDFEEYKLRIISLNTVEEANSNIACSTAQYNWLISSLDLTTKSDASQWQMLILSHHPLDWWTANGTYYFGNIINAYQNGTSWSSGGVSCNFSGKNSAKLIGNIHGHIHNLLTDYIRSGDPGGASTTQVLRMCTPEACIERANQYDGVWKDAVTYNKTKDTADDTSFCVYCIDLDTHVINAVCYGAGYDRSVNYAGDIETFNISYNLTRVTSSNTASSIARGQTFETTLTPDSGAFTSVNVTMGGVNITASVWNESTKKITITPVTGNIVITAIGKDGSSDDPNLLPMAVNADGTLYNNGQGWATGKRLGTEGTEKEASGMEVTGFMSFPGNITDDTTIYFSNIKWPYTDSTTNQYCYCAFYDGNKNNIISIKLDTGGIVTSSYSDITCDENNNIISIGVKKTAAWFSVDASNAKYFRISAAEITNNSIITVDVPIVDDSGNSGGNSGTASYTNQIPISQNSSGGLYSSTGYKTNTRLNSSGTETTQSNWEATGFIPITKDSIVRFANIDWNSDGVGKDYLAVYDSSFNKLGSDPITNWLTAQYEPSNPNTGKYVLDSNGNLTYLDMSILAPGNFANGGRDALLNMKYMRISACNITTDSIITVNQEIK